MKSEHPSVRYYGTIQIGSISLECVVLADGKSGYVKRQFLEAIGVKGKNLSTRFHHFLAEIAPNALTLLEKSEYPVVKMPSGGNAHWRSRDVKHEIKLCLPCISRGILAHAHRGAEKPCGLLSAIPGPIPPVAVAQRCDAARNGGSLPGADPAAV